MGPPSGGRNTVCGRFTRHMNIFSIDAFDDATLDHIFGTIVTWHFAAHSDTTIQRLGRVRCFIFIIVKKVKLEPTYTTHNYGAYLHHLLPEGETLYKADQRL